MNLTVVIPTYNAAGHLGESLPALREFALAGAEILLVDDGSDDNTAEVFSDMSSGWPTARVVQAPHKGLGATRNRGIIEASREFLAFMDSDDALCLGGASAMIEELQTSGAPAVRGGEISRQAGQIHQCRRGDGTKRMLRADRAMLRGFGGTLRFIYRREFLISQGLQYPENLSFAEDLVFYVRFAMACPEFLDMHVDYYCYTTGRAGQLTSQDRADTWRVLPGSLDVCIGEAALGSPDLRASVAALVNWYALRGLPQADPYVRQDLRPQLRELSKSARRRLRISRVGVGRRLATIGLARLFSRADTNRR